MTTRELLENYRATLLELDELQSQIERTGTDGRPAGCRSQALSGASHGTNAPAAAALQLADGLEALAARKRDELAQMSEGVYALLNQINDSRTFMVIQRYYLMAETDANIGAVLCITRPRVNQIRQRFLAAQDGTALAATAN